MERLIQWLETDGNALAVLVALGVGLLFVCGMECMTSPSREEDDLFHRHAL